MEEDALPKALAAKAIYIGPLVDQSNGLHQISLASMPTRCGSRQVIFHMLDLVSTKSDSVLNCSPWGMDANDFEARL